MKVVYPKNNKMKFNPEELFPYIKALFEEPKFEEEVGAVFKKRHFFMLNRIVAKAYPLAANDFNHIRINPISATDCWCRVLGGQYKKTPAWVYTKGKGRKEEKPKSKNYQPSEELIDWYCQKKEISRREFFEIFDHNPEHFENVHKKIEKSLLASKEIV